jgi:MurNAc alpha-1-phosphate uridylyltransferase
MMFKPNKAFLLAAGKGTRLRPYTDTMPKPMVPVNGRSIIKRALEKLAAEDVKNVVVNLYHLGDVLKTHLQDWQHPKIIFSQETELLETGGGVKKALSHFGDDPFYMINGDALWSDEDGNTALSMLAQNWNNDRMDMVLLLQPVSGMSLTNGVGDYTIEKDGRARRTPDKNGTHMFAGIRIVHPRLFNKTPDGAFGFLSLMDKAEQQGRLYAVEHRGAWHHISTPEELERVDAHYKEANA